MKFSTFSKTKPCAPSHSQKMNNFASSINREKKENAQLSQAMKPSIFGEMVRSLTSTSPLFPTQLNLLNPRFPELLILENPYVFAEIKAVCNIIKILSYRKEFLELYATQSASLVGPGETFYPPLQLNQDSWQHFWLLKKEEVVFDNLQVFFFFFFLKSLEMSLDSSSLSNDSKTL